MLVNLLFVAVGSALGGVARYLVALALAGRTPMFPLATLSVNVVGSLVIGVLAMTAPMSPHVRLLAVTGFCGGFTTFSAFSLETLSLEGVHAAGLAMMNIALNLVLSIAACWIGLRLGSRLS